MGTSHWSTDGHMAYGLLGQVLVQGRLRSRVLLCVVLLTLVVGCGGSKLVPVTGLVTLDTKPVSDAGVMFCPVGPGPAVSGVTDAAGRFQLTTMNKGGAMVGQYRVAITKKITSGGGLGVGGPQQTRVTWLVPERYSQAETSGLQAVVGQDQREFNFALTSK
jgi:hypothetical protein